MRDIRAWLLGWQSSPEVLSFDTSGIWNAPARPVIMGAIEQPVIVTAAARPVITEAENRATIYTAKARIATSEASE